MNHTLPLRAHLATQHTEMTLEQLAAAIHQEALLVERGWRSRIKAGRLLTQVKQRVGHGNFGPWLKQNFRHSERTAQMLMKEYDNWCDKSAGRSVESMSLEELSDLSAPKPPKSADLEPKQTNYPQSTCDENEPSDPPPPIVDEKPSFQAEETQEPAPADAPNHRTTATPTASTGSNPKPPKNGAVLYNLKQLDEGSGKLVRLVDAIGSAYHVSQSNRADRIRKDISILREDIKAWEKELAHK